MELEQAQRGRAGEWVPAPPGRLGTRADLVLVFGAKGLIDDDRVTTDLRLVYPRAIVLGCSTAGEICDAHVSDDSVVVTAVAFEHSCARMSSVRMSEVDGSFEAGKSLAQGLPHDGLVHVFVLSDGLSVNGSDLVRGLVQGLPADVRVTGGLSADGGRFEETLVLLGGDAQPGVIGAIGLYGDRLRVGYASLGSWDPFGPERLVTRSERNVLYELDARSALNLYKTYLGEHARDLPASALLFPLSLRTKEGDSAVVRTVLAVDEERQSMTFAGDVPTGAYVRLMKANFDRLIDGAVGAAKASYATMDSGSPDLAILISCVGRKMVLKQRIEEEIEGVREVLGSKTVLTGFYSYGEISPFTRNARCELHNQTMTITTLSERAA